MIFQHDVFRLLIIAPSKKDRLTQLFIGADFCEFDLANLVHWISYIPNAAGAIFDSGKERRRSISNAIRDD